jgi:hypothetical protein
MPDGLDLDGDLIAGLFIGADMGEGELPPSILPSRACITLRPTASPSWNLTL